MQQIASLGLLLTIFDGFGQVLCESGSTARNVIGDIREKFTITGGTAVQGHLFRQCANEAAAVEGSLYSIDVTESKGFVRAVLKEDQDVAWTDTGLEADQGVVQCAIKALEVGAQAYKYDGLCWAHLQGVLQDLLTTDCGPGDVVYVRKPCSPGEFQCNDGECVAETVRCDGSDDCAAGEDELVCDFNRFQGERIPYGEYSGCFYSSPNGMTFGETSDRLVEEHLPSNITCCPFLDNGVCVYVDDIAEKDINFCEAVARCEAFGLSMMSNDFLDPYVYGQIVALTSSGDVVDGIPMNYVRDDQGVWRWMPSEEIEPTKYTPLPNEANVDQNCAVRNFKKLEYVAMNCEDAVGYNSMCVQTNSQLPKCV